MVSLAREVALSNGWGKGANIYSALYNLEKYSRSSNPTALDEAIYHLLIELVRLKYLQK